MHKEEGCHEIVVAALAAGADVDAAKGKVSWLVGGGVQEGQWWRSPSCA